MPTLILNMPKIPSITLKRPKNKPKRTLTVRNGTGNMPQKARNMTENAKNMPILAENVPYGMPTMLKFEEQAKRCQLCRVFIFVLIFTFGLHFAVPTAEALKVRYVTVPGYSANGDEVVMHCHYDLEGDQLYSVKWYKGYREFYRFVPADSPQIQVYAAPGVHVDMNRSTPSKVVLRKVSRQSSGKYRCEVSAEAPTFDTDSGIGELLVADVPDHIPSISGLQRRYHVGDMVHVNCTSYKSKPAASLSWYINGKKADQSYSIEYTPITDEEGLETSTLGLRFVARAHHLRHNELHLRCTATIASVYYKEKNVRIKGRLTHRRVPIQRPPARSSAPVAFFIQRVFLFLLALLPQLR